MISITFITLDSLIVVDIYQFHFFLLGARKNSLQGLSFDLPRMGE